MLLTDTRQSYQIRPSELQLKKEIFNLKARNEQLYWHLRRYGQHTPDCKKSKSQTNTYGHIVAGQCDCGLIQALTESSQ